MSIQNIIDNAQQIEISRKKVVGQTISRSQRIKTSERASATPWRFKVTPPASLPWTESRGFIEVIDFNDRATEYEVSLNNNSRMNYITSYMGDCRQSQLDGMTVTNYTTSTLTISGLPALFSEGETATITTSSIMFAQGDFIQPENSRYPYTVLNTVRRGTGTSVTVTLNRPIITSEVTTITNAGILVGNDVTWRMVLTTMPSYSLVPIKRVQYNGDFELVERII